MAEDTTGTYTEEETATVDTSNSAAPTDDGEDVDVDDAISEDDDEDDDDDSESSDMESLDLGFDPENLDEEPINRTYGIDLKTHRIKGFVDGKDAVMQAIWKILSTVRHANYIYSEEYGCDIMNRIYNSSLSEEYLNTDVPAMIEECLTQDDRITGVSDFSWERSGSDGVRMQFTANTIYGDLQVEGEV